MLHIYNSLTRKKQPFQPMEPGRVGIYVCGMTVYDHCHLGHARALVAFDMVVRYLRHAGYAVTHVRNITDVDDKIIRRSAEQGIEPAVLTERYIAAMHEDEAALGVLPPDREPRATAAIDDMLALIATLIARGSAYQGASGDVYFDVTSFPDYGRLSGKRLDELRAGARVEVEPDKRHPGDFVLWKRARPGELQWASPWGAGRPGWHIECSAMSMRCLGEHFDIHGGGLDLQFPHHENEIAQSEAATGKPFANVWMHNGHVRIDEEKMSKSLGNFLTVREVLQRHRPEALRYLLLSSHYRSPLNYADETLVAAEAALGRLYLALRGLAPPSDRASAPLPALASALRERYHQAMDDDFNSPEAIAVLFELAREINRLRDRDGQAAALLATQLRELGGVLGLLQAEPEEYLQGAAECAAQALSTAQIEAYVDERTHARANRDFRRADAIRALLEDAGVVLEDSPEGTRWRR
jgi:cysteinyl-tRNA synthetase